MIRFGVRAVKVEPPELDAPTVDANAPDDEPIETGTSPESAFTPRRRTDAAPRFSSRATSPSDGGSSMSATPPVLMPSVESFNSTTPSVGGWIGVVGVSTGSDAGASFIAWRSTPRSVSSISTDVTSPFPPATTITISPEVASAWTSSVSGFVIGRFILTNVAPSVDTYTPGSVASELTDAGPGAGPDPVPATTPTMRPVSQSTRTSLNTGADAIAEWVGVAPLTPTIL